MFREFHKDKEVLKEHDRQYPGKIDTFKQHNEQPCVSAGQPDSALHFGLKIADDGAGTRIWPTFRPRALRLRRLSQ